MAAVSGLLPLLVDEILKHTFSAGDSGNGSSHEHERVHVNVVVPQEGIFLAMHALLEAHDTVIVTTPAYQSLFEVARSIG